MMGSHAQYANRYPLEFEKFEGNNVRAYEKNLSQSKINSINQYDNSILYTDFFVQQTLALLEQDTADIKALTLFADHGEEVYDKINVKGHGPDNVTANMIEIPLITWMSNGFKNLKPQTMASLMKNKEQSFQLDNLYHYATALMGISSSSFVDYNKSLSSNQYLPPKERKVYKRSYENGLRYRK